MSGKEWTQQEIETVAAQFPGYLERKISVTDLLARFPGRSYPAIETKYYKLQNPQLNNRTNGTRNIIMSQEQLSKIIADVVAQATRGNVQQVSQPVAVVKKRLPQLSGSAMNKIRSLCQKNGRCIVSFGTNSYFVWSEDGFKRRQIASRKQAYEKFHRQPQESIA